MSDLDAFRSEMRAWLEANCPAEMREAVRDEADICWGGRNFKFKTAAQKAWLDACVAKGLTVPRLAQGLRRRWAGCGAGQGAARGNEPDQRAPAALQLRDLDAWASTA